MRRLIRILAVAGLYALVASFAAPLIDHSLAEHAPGDGRPLSRPSAAPHAPPYALLQNDTHYAAGLLHGGTNAPPSGSVPCVLPCSPLTDGRVMASAQDIAPEHVSSLAAPDIRPTPAPEAETGLLSASLPQVTPPPRA